MSETKYVKTSEGVHGIGLTGEFTLCGDTIDGDDACELEPCEETTSKRLTCPRCVALVVYCRQFKYRMSVALGLNEAPTREAPK